MDSRFATDSKSGENRRPEMGVPPNASIAALFWTFFRIGAFTIGGGYVMVPLIREP